jgi:hypothetical protein
VLKPIDYLVTTNGMRPPSFPSALGRTAARRSNFVLIPDLPDKVQTITLLEVIARLRCKGKGCGGKPKAVEIRHHMSRYQLLGPEP